MLPHNLFSHVITNPRASRYYGHGHESADAGWGFAAWSITDSFSDFYADDVFDVAWYPNLKWYMTNWVTAASSTPSGLFPITFWGDWANYVRRLHLLPLSAPNLTNAPHSRAQLLPKGPWPVRIPHRRIPAILLHTSARDYSQVRRASGPRGRRGVLLEPRVGGSRPVRPAFLQFFDGLLCKLHVREPVLRTHARPRWSTGISI